MTISQPPKCVLCAFSTLKPNAPDAHIETLLFTNIPPESADLVTVSSQLESAMALSAKLNEWIRVIKESQGRMLETKIALEKSIRRHKGVLHPIRSIPDDILLAIFEWCTFFDTQGKNPISMCENVPPWTLSHVSHRWRALALASPHLWSTINICPLRSQVQAGRRAQLVSWLAEYIRRSAQCDIVIHVAEVYEGRRRDSTDDKLVGECLLELLPTTDRWRRAEFVCVPYTMLVPFSGRSFNCLTRLKVIFHRTQASTTAPLRLSAPNLTHLTMVGDGSALVELPWERLKYYVCGDISLQHLPKCVALEELKVCRIYPDSSLQTFDSMHISTITLPALRSVTLTYHELYHSTPQLSDYLILPSLITLRLDFDKLASTYPPFRGAIRHIRNLILTVLDSDGQEPVLAFLGECSSVTSLFLDGSDETLAALEISEDPASDHVIVLPNLTLLCVSAYLMENIAGRVMDIILSRSRCGRGCRALRKFAVLQYPGQAGVWEDIWREKIELTPELMEKWMLVKEIVKVIQFDKDALPFDNV